MADSVEKIVNTTLNVNTAGGVNSVNALMGAFNSLGGGVTGVISSLMKFAPQIAIIGGAVAVIGGIAMALNQAKNAAADFQKDMANVNTLLAGSIVGIKQLSDEVLVMSGNIPLATKDLANGLYQVVSAGIPAAEAMDILATGAKAAVGGVTDSATSLKVLIGVINAYGYSTSDANMVSDKLFEAVKLGIFNYQELATTLGTVIPQAVSLKVPLDTLLAGMVGLTRGGYDAAQASTALRGVLNQLLSPSDALAATVKKLGYENAESMVKTLGLKGMLDKLADSTGGSASEMAKLFPEVRGMGAVMSLTGNQAGSFAEAIDSITNSTGAADEAFKAQMSTLRENEQLMKNNFKKVLIELGEKTLPFATRAVIGLTGALGDLALAWMNPGPGTPLGGAQEKLAAIEKQIEQIQSHNTGTNIQLQEQLGPLIKARDLYRQFLKGSITEEEMTVGITYTANSGSADVVTGAGPPGGMAEAQRAAAATAEAKAAAKKRLDAQIAADKEYGASVGQTYVDLEKLTTSAYTQDVKDLNTLYAKRMGIIKASSSSETAQAKDIVALNKWKSAQLSAIKEAQPAAKKTDAQTAVEQAQKAVDPARESAEKDINNSLLELKRNYYKATHTLVEGEMYDINLQAKDYLAAGLKKNEVDKWVATSKAEIDRQAAATTLETAKAANEAAFQATVAANQALVDNKRTATDQISQVIVDGYQLQYNAAVKAENDATTLKQKGLTDSITAMQKYTTDATAQVDSLLKIQLNALNAKITAEQKYTTEATEQVDSLLRVQLASIDTAKNAQLDALQAQADAQTGSIDAQIKALQDADQAESRAETMAGLQTTLSNAKTPQAIAAAQAAIQKEKNKEEYDDKLASLQAQRTAVVATAAAERKQITDTATVASAAAQSTADAKKAALASELASVTATLQSELTAAQNAADIKKAALASDLADIVTKLQNELTAEQTANAIKLTDLDTYYSEKMLKRNADAAAEVMVAQNTWATIQTMMQTTQAAWAGNPAVANSAFSNISTLTGTTIPAVTGASVNVQANGKAPSGLSVGTTVKTGGGDYIITKVNYDGSYASVPATGGGTKHYGNGGTAWYPQFALIGENGPEDIVPHDSKPTASQQSNAVLTSQLNTVVKLLYRLADGVPDISSNIQKLGRGLGAQI